MLRRIVGVPQHYSWGDHTSIPSLLGFAPDGNSWAEMWFGTHHVAPAHLDTHDGPLLSDNAGHMDMLVKLLAAGQPLSLQTHPNKEQARRGCAREDAAGIDISAPHRMYRDASDKPEILIALTPFEALCGFKTPDVISTLFAEMQWATELDVLSTHGIAGYLKWCFAQDTPPQLMSCPQWLRDIAQIYPNDPGLRVAPLLHHVVLAPGEAICLPAGNLHAYIKGCGVEVMNSSDNVVRAGFTPKHINVEELLAIVDTSPLATPVITPDASGTYLSPSDAFSVQHIVATGECVFDAVAHHRVIFGPLSEGSGTSPQMFFLAAGETGSLDAHAGDKIFICHQL
ncbi:MAG: mannose-6-phosphate isomerase, class I [Actinobacteria bacterium]|uniref:mannose-6-phosphate isomerase n=1 Tax=freshwater metagenome TaxID=449393 RepID=A0A6J6D618_9ZZZZ|nr:mannose-6-phosphate isomerase, class I [Actinomycetota bacterium]